MLIDQGIRQWIKQLYQLNGSVDQAQSRTKPLFRDHAVGRQLPGILYEASGRR